MDSETNKVLTCYHCGNQTLMIHMKTAYFADHDDKEHTIDTYYWTIYRCPVCNKITLEEASNFSPITDFEGNPIYDYCILYPDVTNSDGARMPSSVHRAFEAALRVKNISTAICALSLRRTLEMMCKEKGETNGSLYDKLRSLAERGFLPPILSDTAHFLRDRGNEAAHADETEFTKEQISLMIDFTNTILDYVYVLPKKLESVQKRSAQIIASKTNSDKPHSVTVINVSLPNKEEK